MFFRVVSDKSTIKKCQQQLIAELKRAFPHSEWLRIGYSGGSFEDRVYYDRSLWFSSHLLPKGKEAKIPRYWNGFGVGKSEKSNQIIVVEINTAIEGSDKTLSGVFARNQNTGQYFLLHRGGIGGSRKGIGKSSFTLWYKGPWAEITEPDETVDYAIPIGPIGGSRLLSGLKKFVRAVDIFKKEVAGKPLGPTWLNAIEIKSFHPEGFGRRTGKRNSIINYDSNHGQVVNQLEEWLKKQNIMQFENTFNSRPIDLGVVANGAVSHIFEVKTSAKTQSIYSGIGQLIFHTKGNNRIKKTLVLPREDCSTQLKNDLKAIGINLMAYAIKNKTVKFRTYP
ncbi:MAG: hypothetical protein AB7T38_07950 [Nitrospirales bacterium]